MSRQRLSDTSIVEGVEDPDMDISEKDQNTMSFEVRTGTEDYLDDLIIY